MKRWSSKSRQDGTQHQLRLTNRTTNRPAKVGKSVSLSGMVGGKWSPTTPTTWRPYVEDLSGRRVTPHVTVNGHPTKTGKRRRTAIDGRTTSAAKRIGRRSAG